MANILESRHRDDLAPLLSSPAGHLCCPAAAAISAIYLRLGLHDRCWSPRPSLKPACLRDRGIQYVQICMILDVSVHPARPFSHDADSAFRAPIRNIPARSPAWVMGTHGGREWLSPRSMLTILPLTDERGPPWPCSR